MVFKTEQKQTVLSITGAANESTIATVISVNNSEALQVEISGLEKEYTVVAHLSDVPPLVVGDQVLLVGTQQGYIVTGRLRSADESALDGFSYKNGKLNLRAGRSVKIQSGDAMIELTASGKIKIDGKNIYSISEGRHRLQGSTIELN